MVGQIGRWIAQGGTAAIVISTLAHGQDRAEERRLPLAPPVVRLTSAPADHAEAHHGHSSEGTPLPHGSLPEVGRRFVPPQELPAAPAGVEELLQRPPIVDGAPDGLTLDTLLSLAAQNNPTLLQARQQVNGTLGEALQAGLYPNPTVHYVAEQIFVDAPNNTDTPGEFQGAAIQQEIVTARKRDISRQKYLLRARSSEWQAVAQSWRVCNDVRIHFWRTLGRREIVDIRAELVKAAEDDAVTVRERYHLGQATKAQLNMADVALQRARLQLLAAENQHRAQFNVLTSTVGMNLPSQPLTGALPGETTLIDFDQALGLVLNDSPEVMAARAKYQSDNVTVQRERAEPIPNVFVQVGSGYNLESNEPVGSAQVFLKVPIFDRNQGTIRQAEADLIRQGGEIRRIELRLRNELGLRYQDYLTALQHVMEFEAVILPQARESYALQLEAYQQNRQNWGDVLHAQRDYYELREQYIDHLVGWRENQVLIQGYLLQGGLEPAPSPTPPGHIDSVPQPR